MKRRKTDFLSLDYIQAFLRKMNKIQVVPLVRWSKSVFYERPPRMLRSGAGMNRLFWHFSTLRHFHGRNPRISTLTILKSSDHPLFKMLSTSARQFCLGISSSGTQWMAMRDCTTGLHPGLRPLFPSRHVILTAFPRLLQQMSIT